MPKITHVPDMATKGLPFSRLAIIRDVPPNIGKCNAVLVWHDFKEKPPGTCICYGHDWKYTPSWMGLFCNCPNKLWYSDAAFRVLKQVVRWKHCLFTVRFTEAADLATITNPKKPHTRTSFLKLVVLYLHCPVGGGRELMTQQDASPFRFTVLTKHLLCAVLMYGSAEQELGLMWCPFSTRMPWHPWQPQVASQGAAAPWLRKAVLRLGALLPLSFPSFSR